jgi:hypothetical protein
MTALEVQFIDGSISALSFDPSSMTKAQVCSTLSARADSLIDEWDEMEWGTDGSEEMAGVLSLAYLSTAKYSSIYWNGATIEPWGSGTSPTPPVIYNIVQADAARHLVAWTIAAFVDKLPTEDERIKAGLRAAAPASGINVGMRLLKFIGLA